MGSWIEEEANMAKSSNRKTKRRREPGPRRKRQTQTFGICALLLAVFTLLAMGLTQEEDAVSPLEAAAIQRADDRANPEGRFDPSEPFQFPISRDFAAISFAMIILCVAVISLFRRESPWWGILSLGFAVAGVFLTHWILILGITLALAIAVEVARRILRSRAAAA
jgi:hypothetical protein